MCSATFASCPFYATAYVGLYLILPVAFVLFTCPQKRLEQTTLNDGNDEDAPKCGSGTMNVVMIGISFFLLFTAFNTIQIFETTVNKTAGYWSLAVLYAFMGLTTLVASPVVRRLGPK